MLSRPDRVLISTQRCVICGAQALRHVRPYRCESPAGKAVFGNGAVVRCEACGQPQFAPLPSDAQLSEYYATEYRRGGRYGADAASVAAFPRDNLFFYNRGASIADLLARQVGPRLVRPRVLDVGAGYGHILHLLGEVFPGAVRVAHELSEPCVEHLRSTGVAVLQGPLAAALGNSQPFDLIVLSHVLEHLRDPVGILRTLHLHLRPGGILYVEVPHVSPDALRRYPDSPWAPRHDEPHLSFFGVEELSKVLRAGRFEPLFVDTAGPTYRDISAFRNRLPPLLPTLRRLMPSPIRTLAQQLAGKVTLADREPAFFQYGGYRIWVRSVSVPA